ncbi:MAG TPA: GNAT family protein [Candidatus Cybelea sp.]|nr:GNAT family protein [Candidatus Cybelea sp.]
MALLDRFSRGNTTPVLHGERVFLRLPQVADWSGWAQLRAESRDFLTPWEPTWPSDALTRSAYRRRLRRHLREAREDTAYALFVVRRIDEALLGGVTLSNVRRGVTQSCSVGYWIGRRHARQGYMTEAMRAVISFVFEELRLRRLEAACLPGNEPSKAVLRRVGFTEEGFARQYLCIDGVWRDHVLFAMLANDPRPR